MIISIIARWLIRMANPEKMVLNSQKKAVKLWNKKGVKTEWAKKENAKKVGSIEDFKTNVPISSKEKVFEQNTLSQLVASKLNTIDFVMMSSGSSSKFSLGVLTQKEMKNAALNTDLFLQLFFKAERKKTLIINASSMGVRVFSNHVVSDTGPRTDIVIGLLKKVSPYYNKTFIIGDPIFVKLMVEESIEKGIDWNSINAYFISGGEWMPETLRSYVHELTGKSAEKPDNGFWVGTYGLTELGYPLFFETAELVNYRSKISRLNTKSSFETETCCTTPFVFYYRANSYYLESIKNENSTPRLVFTTLDKNKLIPLFRYDTGDVGELIPKNQLEFENQPMPLVRFWGRDNNFINYNGNKIHVSDIKDMLFANKALNKSITGFFTLKNTYKQIQLTVQLKKGKTANDEQKLALFQQINSIYPNAIDIQFSDYNDMKYQMELDFERKFNPLIEKS